MGYCHACGHWNELDGYLFRCTPCITEWWASRMAAPAVRGAFERSP